MHSSSTQPVGISRRDALRRVAVVGGTLAWSAPLLQTVSLSADATVKPSPKPTATPACDYYTVKAVFWVDKYSCYEQTFVVTPISSMVSAQLDDIKTSCTTTEIQEWVYTALLGAFQGTVT